MNFFHNIDNLDFNKGVGLTLLNGIFLMIPTFSQISAIISLIGSMGALVLTAFGIYQAYQRVKINSLELKKRELEQTDTDS